MKYIFTVHLGDVSRSSVFEVESNSLLNAVRLLAFDIYRAGFGPCWNFVLSPSYWCVTSKSNSGRFLSKKNLDFFRDYYMKLYDSSVMIY